MVEVYGAFYSPDSGKISIALGYMDGGSLAGIECTKKFMPKQILSVITAQGLSTLHALDFFPVKFWFRTLSLKVYLVGFLTWSCHHRGDTIIMAYCEFVNG